MVAFNSNWEPYKIAFFPIAGQQSMHLLKRISFFGVNHWGDRSHSKKSSLNPINRDLNGPPFISQCIAYVFIQKYTFEALAGDHITSNDEFVSSNNFFVESQSNFSLFRPPREKSYLMGQSRTLFVYIFVLFSSQIKYKLKKHYWCACGLNPES